MKLNMTVQPYCKLTGEMTQTMNLSLALIDVFAMWKIALPAMFWGVTVFYFSRF